MTTQDPIETRNEELNADELVFNDGDDFFDCLISSIDEAKHHVSIETYIFDFDSLGKRILHRLIEAASRAVKVRILMDGVGCAHWSLEEGLYYKKRGIDIRFFHPLPWQKSARKIWSSLSVRSILYGFKKLQSRNHRKVYLIDQKVAFLGSMNISERHLKSARGTQAWRDTALRVTGSIVTALDEAFQKTWVESDPPWNPHGGHLGRIKNFFRQFHPRLILNDTFQKRRSHHKELLQKIANAKTRIWITNPYFVPDHKLLKQLSQKAQQIDICLLLPKKSDFFGVQFAMEHCYERLLRAGVKIYNYLPSMLHAKILVVDDFVSVGSTNLDHLSLFHNFEADLVVAHQETKRLIDLHFMEDLTRAELVTLEKWNRRPLHYRLLERIFYFFRTVL